MRLALEPVQKLNETRRRRPDSSAFLREDRSSLPDFQRRAGNQAIQELFRSGLLQAKLTVGDIDDPAEREADAVAASIMGAPAGREMSEKTNQGGSLLQRHPLRQDTSSSVPGIVEQALHSAGRPLDPATRAFFEPRFGNDFSQVRVHTDAQADESARSINALAYTVGRDVVFGSGQFAPGTTAGNRVLAHELTHVIQQSDHRAERIQRQVSPASAHLQSPRFSASAKLERCFEDTDRLGQGDPDTDAVKRIQQALLDVQTITGNTYDLGSTGPNKDGVDGDYGPKTAAAVKKFKADENLGFTQFGDVGPGTMHRLDELFLAGPAPPAPTPTAPTPTAVPVPPTPAPPTPAPAPIPPTSPIPPSAAGSRCPTPSTSGVKGIQKAGQDFSGRSTTRFGVGEAVFLSFDSFLSRGAEPANKAVPHGGLKWVLTDGPGSLTNVNERAGTALFTSNQDSKGKNVELELRVLVGPCAGSAVAKVSFEIIKPSGGFMELEPGTEIAHIQNQVSVGFQGRIFLRPKDVSFMAMTFQEETVVAKATGFFKDLDKDPHPVGPIDFVGPGDSTKGCKVLGLPDNVATRAPKNKKLEKGTSTFEWNIPWMFSVGGAQPEEFTRALQKAEADEFGKASIEKKGAGPFSKELGEKDSGDVSVFR